MIIRRRAYVLLAILGLVVAGVLYVRHLSVVGYILQHPEIDDPIRHEKLGPSSFFRYVFRATFDGEPVAVDQLVECRPLLASGGIGGGTYLMYEIFPPRAGARLSTGGFVYFQLPNYCRFNPGSREWKSYWRPDEPVEAPTLTSWVDDLENPGVIELYTTPETLNDEASRLRITEARVTFLPRGFEPETKPKTDAALMKLGGQGWTLVPLPKEVGEEIFREGKSLSKSTSDRLEEFEMSERLRELIYSDGISFNKYMGHIRHGIPLTLPEIMLLDHERKLRPTRGRLIAGQTIPLSWDGAIFQIEEHSPRGLAYMYPGSLGAQVHATLGREKAVLALGNDRLSLATNKNRQSRMAICDHLTSTCYRTILGWSQRYDGIYH